MGVLGSCDPNGAAHIAQSVPRLVKDFALRRLLLHVCGEASALCDKTLDHPVENGALVVPLSDICL